MAFCGFFPMTPLGYDSRMNDTITASLDNGARVEAWNTYWAAGPLHSCAGSFDGNYGGAIGEFWKPLFESLEPGQKVLDLATGNGPLPALLAGLKQLDADRMPRIVGIDLAEPAPRWLEPLDPDVRDRVNLQGGVRMEALPFEDDEFDMIVSQYGFEYADRAGALAEVLRVARPEATIALVCHHAGSRLVEVASSEVTHLEWLLDESPVLADAERLLPFIAKSGTPEGVAALRQDADANAARDRFNQSFKDLAERAKGATIPDALHEVQDGLPQLIQLATKNGGAAAVEALERWRQLMRNAALRSRELCEFALDGDAVAGLAEGLRAGGFEVTTGELADGHYLMGWSVLARRGRIN
jgi:SAM-dependent methyltransferase